eukprot:410130_1
MNLKEGEAVLFFEEVYEQNSMIDAPFEWMNLGLWAEVEAVGPIRRVAWMRWNALVTAAWEQCEETPLKPVREIEEPLKPVCEMEPARQAALVTLNTLDNTLASAAGKHRESTREILVVY